MNRLLAAALLGLSTGALLHTSPRQRADAAEHALGWICRMTFSHCASVPAATLTGNTAQHRQAKKGMAATAQEGTAPKLRTGKCASRNAIAEQAATYFLRMLGLPRMRTTPVELRPL